MPKSAMPDNLNDRGVHEPWELEWWSKKLGLPSIALEATPEMIETLRQIVAASGEPPAVVFTKALGLYKSALDAEKAGKHVGVAESADALELEYVGIGRPKAS